MNIWVKSSNLGNSKFIIVMLISLLIFSQMFSGYFSTLYFRLSDPLSLQDPIIDDSINSVNYFKSDDFELVEEELYKLNPIIEKLDINSNKIDDNLDTLSMDNHKPQRLLITLTSLNEEIIDELTFFGNITVINNNLISIQTTRDRIQSISEIDHVLFIQKDSLAHASLNKSPYEWGFGKLWNIDSGIKSHNNIALLDTGVDISNPALVNEVLFFEDFIGRSHNASNDEYQVARDINGHGTTISSIIVGNPSTNNHKYQLFEEKNIFENLTSSILINSIFPDFFQLSLDWASSGVDNPNTWLSLSIKSVLDNSVIYSNSEDIILISSGKYDLYVRLEPGQYYIDITQINDIILTNFSLSAESHRLKNELKVDPFHGLAFGNDIVMLKTLDDMGVGSVQATLEAINWIKQNWVEYNITTVNLSYSFDSVIPFIDNELMLLRDLGLIIIAATGNTGLAVDSSPSSSAGVIGVGSINYDRIISDYTSGNPDILFYGALFAPFVMPFGDSNKYRFSEGTSISAAIITSIVHLLLDKLDLIYESHNSITQKLKADLVLDLINSSLDKDKILNINTISELLSNKIKINTINHKSFSKTDLNSLSFSFKSNSSTRYNIRFFMENINYTELGIFLINKFGQLSTVGAIDKITETLFSMYSPLESNLIIIAKFYGINSSEYVNYVVNHDPKPLVQIQPTFYSNHPLVPIIFNSSTNVVDLYINESLIPNFNSYTEIELNQTGNYNLTVIETIDNFSATSYSTLIYDDDSPVITSNFSQNYVDGDILIEINVSDNSDIQKIQLIIDGIIHSETKSSVLSINETILEIVTAHTLPGNKNITICGFDIASNMGCEYISTNFNHSNYLLSSQSSYTFVQGNEGNIIFNANSLVPSNYIISRNGSISGPFAWDGNDIVIVRDINLASENITVTISTIDEITMGYSIITHYVDIKNPVISFVTNDLSIQNNTIDITYNGDISFSIVEENLISVIFDTSIGTYSDVDQFVVTVGNTLNLEFASNMDESLFSVIVLVIDANGNSNKARLDFLLKDLQPPIMYKFPDSFINHTPPNITILTWGWVERYPVSFTVIMDGKIIVEHLSNINGTYSLRFDFFVAGTHLIYFSLNDIGGNVYFQDIIIEAKAISLLKYSSSNFNIDIIIASLVLVMGIILISTVKSDWRPKH